MKNHCGESVGFSFRARLWFRRPVILFKINVIIRPSWYFYENLPATRVLMYNVKTQLDRRAYRSRHGTELELLL